jgi:hypothetical protein
VHVGQAHAPIRERPHANDPAPAGDAHSSSQRIPNKNDALQSKWVPRRSRRKFQIAYVVPEP